MEFVDLHRSICVCVCHDQFNHVKHKMYFSCVLCFLCLLLLLFCFFVFSKLFVHSVSMFSVGGLKESSCLHDNCLSIYLSKYLSIDLSNIYMIYIYRYIYHISLVAW